jgi:hypothetical protein
MADYRDQLAFSRGKTYAAQASCGRIELRQGANLDVPVRGTHLKKLDDNDHENYYYQ